MEHKERVDSKRLAEMDVDEEPPSGGRAAGDGDAQVGSGGQLLAEPKTPCTPTTANAVGQPATCVVLDSPEAGLAAAQASSTNDSKRSACGRDLPARREANLKRCKADRGLSTPPPAPCRPLVFGAFVAPAAAGSARAVDVSPRHGSRRAAAPPAPTGAVAEGGRRGELAVLTGARLHAYGGPTAVHAVRYMAVPSSQQLHPFHRSRNQENVPSCGHLPAGHGSPACSPAAVFPRSAAAASNFLQHHVSLPTQTCHHGKPPCFAPAHYMHQGRTQYVGTPHPAAAAAAVAAAAARGLTGRRTPPSRSAGASSKTISKGLYQTSTCVLPPSGQSTPMGRPSQPRLNSSGEEDRSPSAERAAAAQAAALPAAQRPQQEQPPSQADHASETSAASNAVAGDAAAAAATSSSSSTSSSPSCSGGDNSATANVPLRQVLGPLDNHSNLQYASPFTEAASRQHHNAKERMRRIKESCQLLRELIPGMTDKTDKATVFEYATQYILYIKQIIGTKYDRDFLQKYSPY